MSKNRLYFVECRLGRAGFSSERYFQVDLGNGKIHEGTSPRHYCFGTDNQMVAAEPPEDDELTPGKIIGKFVNQENGCIVLALPDGCVVEAPSNVAEEYKGESPDVSVRT